jgi:hypothetical protein
VASADECILPAARPLLERLHKRSSDARTLVRFPDRQLVDPRNGAVSAQRRVLEPKEITNHGSIRFGDEQARVRLRDDYLKRRTERRCLGDKRDCEPSGESEDRVGVG